MRDQVSAKNLSMSELLNQPPQWKHSVLGALCFSAGGMPEDQMLSGLEIPCMNVPMTRLDTTESICEVWHGSGQMTQGRCGDIHYSHDANLLFGVIALPESLSDTSAGKTPLQQATELAYYQAFDLLDTLHFPYLFRVWNYMADINVHSFGLERYQQFNRGRQDAFLAHGRDVAGNVPAACALGYGHWGGGRRDFPRKNSPQWPLTIAFLAGREAPLSMENPRQISAFQYPPQYGPRSPVFSRASLVRMGENQVLFISGTASIVGHATLHPNDVVAQTRETMANIEAVLAEVNRQAIRDFDLASLSYKVYVRHPVDFQQIRAELVYCVGDSLKAVYLHAEVCRQDLLLEIEATATHSSVFLSGQVS